MPTGPKLSVMTEKETQVLQERIALFNDEVAFKQLFKHYYTALLRFAIAITKEKEPAEEIVGDQFVNIWNKRSSITNISNLKLYLYIAVRNRCLNFIRRNGNIYTITPEQTGTAFHDVTPDPENIMIASELLQAVNKAILELPPKCREVYTLVKEDGLSYKEVAELLNISPRTVENHIATAVRKLAASLNIDLSSYRRSSILPS